MRTLDRAAFGTRRGFLRDLARLPLLGGSVSVIGAPSAAAEPVTIALVEAYKTWLHGELAWLCWEMAGDPALNKNYPPALRAPDERIALHRVIEGTVLTNPAGTFHGLNDPAKPSDRAALVMSAVGCEWRTRGR